MSKKPEDIPDIILIVGIDAAGKDHLAKIAQRLIRERGGCAEKRKNLLSGSKAAENTSGAKTALVLFLERAFLVLLPFFGFLLPRILTVLLQRDLRKFKTPGEKLIIIGHRYLRGLAIYWALRYPRKDLIPLPQGLTATLAEMRTIPSFHTIVLSVDQIIRKRRITKRRTLGEADVFDRYMEENPEVAKHTEDILVWLTRQFLGAQLIVNNDLPEEELRRLIVRES
ncbi:hypothetical protein [Desulfopila inferna]|uniref:hypothetical protein n=1 Tax=Desulfopila inferna TaxID=468528 RepID=UPI0019658393|nr:hypothetical protein [Desulfopila inferna]MBM9606060.1 hypothetical protein [Desulfopila inferna]